MPKISIKVTNDYVEILLGPTSLVSLASSPSYRERVDRKSLLSQFQEIYDSHADEIDQFADQVKNDTAHSWNASPKLREKLVAFRDEHDGHPRQLPSPPIATELEGGRVIQVDDFIEWAKPYQLTVSSVRWINPDRMTPFNWMGHALRFVKMLKRTKVREFVVTWNEKQMDINYRKGKAVLPIDGHYAPGQMDYLFRSYVEDVERNERANRQEAA